jgi:outer membrane protein
VRKFQIGYESAQLETSKARAGHLPTLDLSGSAGRGRTNGQSQQGIAPTVNYSGSTSQSTVALTLNVPLFAGFSVQNRVKETLLLEEQARNNLEANRRVATQNARTAFFGAQSLQARVKALEAAETSSKVALDATQLGYKVGVRVNLDVLNAQTQLYSTQRDLARARYDVLLNQLRLRQTAGILNPSDVSSVNSLLAK